MPDIYQPKYEHLLMDPNQGDPADAVHPPYNPAKLAELKALITLAGDTPSSHGFPAGKNLANAATGNVTSTVLTSVGKYFTNDILLRIVTTVGSTPTATFNIKAAPDATTYTNINYAVIATPQTFVSTAIVITTATTNIYRIPASALLAAKANSLEVVVTANTNVTLTIDAWDFGGVPL
jgi:hypothetical protein